MTPRNRVLRESVKQEREAVAGAQGRYFEVDAVRGDPEAGMPVPRVEGQIISVSSSGRGCGITTLFTSMPFCPTTCAPASTALCTAATLPVNVTKAFPPSAMASRISINWTLAAFTAASAPSISEATENDSTIPSASSSSTLDAPLMAGKTDSCRFGITNESITEKRLADRTITMYLPEQMERDSTRSTFAAFNIASQVWNPAAMLVSSINPSEFCAMFFAEKA
ncbi:hypothetical protein SBA4_1010064 [Candidatus Sulfopaludibacter sp. SbA4]|nr:hypothetical protein SBA4_1010064 [Candidatus Sulfopaludibacter sp. SbA4]